MKIATLAIITRWNQVLLGVRKSKSAIGEGKLNGPGGKQKQGETLIECLIRETREEVGIELNPAKLEKCAIITFYAGGVPDFEVHVYRTSHFSGEMRETDEMIPDWYDYGPAHIRRLVERMFDSDYRWFPQLVNGFRFCANVYYQERGKGFLDMTFSPFTG